MRVEILLTLSPNLDPLRNRGGMKESGIGRENGLEAIAQCAP